MLCMFSTSIASYVRCPQLIDRHFMYFQTIVECQCLVRTLNSLRILFESGRLGEHFKTDILVGDLLPYRETLMIMWVMWLHTLGKVSSPLRKVLALISLSASLQDGFMVGRSGSCVTASILLWKSNSTQSMIRMIRWGGLASFLTEIMKAKVKVTMWSVECSPWFMKVSVVNLDLEIQGRERDIYLSFKNIFNSTEYISTLIIGWILIRPVCILTLLGVYRLR